MLNTPFFKSQTFLWAPVIIILAAFSALLLYSHEAESIRLMCRGAALGANCQLTPDEQSPLIEDAMFVFLVCLGPLVPWLMLHRHPVAQAFVLAIPVLVFMLAITATPGGDNRGCEDCVVPVLASGTLSLLGFFCALILLVVAWMLAKVRHRRKSSELNK